MCNQILNGGSGVTCILSVSLYILVVLRNRTMFCFLFCALLVSTKRSKWATFGRKLRLQDVRANENRPIY